jgi:hypothetical protein
VILENECGHSEANGLVAGLRDVRHGLQNLIKVKNVSEALLSMHKWQIAVST